MASTYLHIFLLDIDEASLPYSLPLHPVINHSDASSGSLAALRKEWARLGESAFGGESGVVAVYVGRALEGLEPSTRLETLVRFLEQSGPILNASA